MKHLLPLAALIASFFLAPSFSAAESAAEDVFPHYLTGWVRKSGADGAETVKVYVDRKIAASNIFLVYQSQTVPPTELYYNDIQVECLERLCVDARVYDKEDNRYVQLIDERGWSLVRAAALKKNPSTRGQNKNSAMTPSLAAKLAEAEKNIPSASANFDGGQVSRSVMAGVGTLGSSEGGSGTAVSFFQRTDVGGGVGVSLGVGIVSVADQTTPLSYSSNGSSYQSLEKFVPGTTAIEVARVDYETPKANGISFYGGVGAGYAWSSGSEQTVSRQGNINSAGRIYYEDRTVVGSAGGALSELFGSAFLGVKLTEQLVIEYERLFSGSGKIDGESVKAGINFGF